MLQDAKNKLSKLVERAEAGEEIIITRDNKQAVRLQPVENEKAERKPGMMKGSLNLPDKFFFEPLPKEELTAWEGSNEDHS
ncbi:MAG: type II toxin-antitoxin system prevent-host-death family antitoxin [Hyphomicrobiaceae bacterium]|nr:type II toxin-antitoxin system prevent-host-death family antitoxin [Hyphomicrobiaceae bacterium]